MAAVRRSDCQRSAGSQNRARYWCAVRAVASSSKRRTSGRTSSALAWVPGLGRSPARSNGVFGICVIRLPDATLHARHGHGQFCLRGQRRVAARLLEHRPSELCISSITLAELRFGAEARRSRKLHRLISTFVETVEVVSFGQSAASRFATVAAALARRGEPIGTFDTLMAAHALSLRLTFVTNNTRHFRRIVGLETENWF